jgi:hypothetical protein
MICTFKPSEKMPFVDFDISCNEKMEEWGDVCHRFEFIPSAWLRKTKETTPFVLHGLEVAARPERHPPVCDTMLAHGNPTKATKGSKAPELKRTDSEVGDYDGWTACAFSPFLSSRRSSFERSAFFWPPSITAYRVQRFDKRAKAGFIGIEVPAKFFIDDFKIPLIDLFAPRKSSEKKGYSTFSW